MTFPVAGRRARAVLATAVLLLLPTLGVAAPAADAGAQAAAGAGVEAEAGGEAGAVGQDRTSLLHLDVATIEGTVTGDRGIRVVTEVTNDSSRLRRNLTLTASVHSRVVSRFDYHRALDERDLGAALDTWSVAVDPLPAGGTTEIAFRRTPEELATVRAHGPGVYPIELALVDDGVAVDGLTTALVVVPEEVDEPLRVNVLAPFETPPPDGESLLERRVGAELTTLATGLAADVPVTVAVDGLVLDEAARRADGGAPPGDRAPPSAAGWSDLLSAVEELAAGDAVQVIPRPYAAADLTALVRGGMGDVAIAAVRDSRAAITGHAGTEADDRTVWPAGGLDRPTLRNLVDEGYDTVVLSEDELALPSLRELPTSPAPVRPLAAGGGSVAAVVPDPWLSAALRADGRRSTALATQRLLAETAVVFFERPYAADPRGLVVAGSQGTAPDGRLPVLLDRLSGAPWVQPVTTAQLLAEVPPDDTPAQLRTTDAQRADELSPSYVAALSRARDRLAGVAASVAGNDNSFDGLDSDLRVAASTWYRGPERTAAGLARIRGVEEAVRAVERAITVADLPVTLASIEAQLPVTLHSNAEVPLRVRVSAESQRYEFDGGSEQRLVLEPGATTVLYAVRALAPGGTHPVRVTVTDDSGVLVLAQSTLVVRSTAVSVVAVVLTVGAALFLGAWWVRDARRRRARRGAHPEPSVAVVSGGRR